MTQKEFEILSVIALRKSKLYKKTIDKLLKELPSHIDQREVGIRLRKAIASLDNSLLISEMEKATNTIDPTLPIEKLNLDRQEIIRQVLRNIGHTEVRKTATT